MNQLITPSAQTSFAQNTVISSLSHGAFVPPASK
jgi:hypothetical protein